VGNALTPCSFPNAHAALQNIGSAMLDANKETVRSFALRRFWLVFQQQWTHTGLFPGHAAETRKKRDGPTDLTSSLSWNSHPTLVSLEAVIGETVSDMSSP